jgi:Beta-ketoacyl synthase, N-terminal domain
MSKLNVYVDAVGLCGPGLVSWAQSQAALSGETIYSLTDAVIPPSNLLPPAERRRVGIAVKLAMACAGDALVNSQYTASELLSVFSSSGGDGDNCHTICEALASADRMISPTRFTNSVHNAPSGYWGIAAQAKPASTSLCAYDASFSSGFLEACTQCIVAQAPVLLIAYDTPYPEPLRATRPITHSFGVAMVLSHTSTAQSIAQLHVSMGSAKLDEMRNAELEALRRNVPAAKSLPLLQALAAKNKTCTLSLAMFDNQQLLIDITS